jgi:hypothetical protein
MLVSNSSANGSSAGLERSDPGAVPHDDAAPEGVPDALWRPLSDAERGLVRQLGAQPQPAPPGSSADELQIALAPGLRAARAQDEVMLKTQVQDAGGDWKTVGSAEAREGRLHVSDLDAVRTAYGQPLPPHVVQSPQALPPAAPRTGIHPSAPAHHHVARHSPAHAPTRAHPQTHAAVHRSVTSSRTPAAAVGTPQAGTGRADTPATGEGLLAHAWHALESMFGMDAPIAPAAGPRPPGRAVIDPQVLARMEVTRRGHAYRESQVVRWSHYDNAIDRSPGRAAGNSRIWGDAPVATQAAAIEALVRASQAAHLDKHQTALVLAIARTESGFNPDAAAGTTSASGLGQFVDRTGAAYGLGNANRWNVDAQATALVHHFLDNQHLAQSRHQGDEYIYKYHHDGPSADYGGLAISTREVMPRAAAYEALLNQGH